MPKLRMTAGGETVEHEITTDALEAGREGCDFTLPAKEASRRHFRIWRHEDGDWRLKDLGSTNGTSVNGLPVMVTRLRHKDTITVGRDCTIVFLDAKPVALKSRAEREKEEKEEAARKKRLDARRAFEAERAASGTTGTASAASIAPSKEAVEIADEQTLDRLMADQEKFDRLLATTEREVVFGDYTLLKRLSAGGMGVVFKARSRKVEGQLVALKLLHTDKVNEENVARFKQEAWAISAFNHRNIVKVADLSKHGGMHYIAMEFVDGEDLLAVGFKHSLTFWQVMEVIDKLADVLRLVHGKNIWHRDIKPQNVLMDRSGEIRLIDFGIATVEREQDDAAETAEGLIMGTPAFLSPEQASRGKMGPIDGRADLYSLGAVMYYLLTGHRPFTGKSAIEILKKNMTEPPPHPQDIEEMAPDGLVEICLKLMEKRPEDRYQGAAALQEALAQWRKSEDGKKERERHLKILELREKKRRMAARQKP
ncbi:MAG TPA: FHA domain-containing serine/threonine-protein kinase [Planctomycetota bacterium]|nr:FHA domain-containing serine/threonine-protein kinase [Planctomycetota bacterium]